MADAPRGPVSRARRGSLSPRPRRAPPWSRHRVSVRRLRRQQTPRIASAPTPSAGSGSSRGNAHRLHERSTTVVADAPDGGGCQSSPRRSRRSLKHFMAGVVDTPGATCTGGAEVPGCPLHGERVHVPPRRVRALPGQRSECSPHATEMRPTRHGRAARDLGRPDRPRLRESTQEPLRCRRRSPATPASPTADERWHRLRGLTHASAGRCGDPARPDDRFQDPMVQQWRFGTPTRTSLRTASRWPERRRSSERHATSWSAHPDRRPPTRSARRAAERADRTSPGRPRVRRRPWQTNPTRHDRRRRAHGRLRSMRTVELPCDPNVPGGADRSAATRSRIDHGSRPTCSIGSTSPDQRGAAHRDADRGQRCGRPRPAGVRRRQRAGTQAGHELRGHRRAVGGLARRRVTRKPIRREWPAEQALQPF